MTGDDLKDLLAKAADIAKDLPDSMQEAGFHRALDALLAEQGLLPDSTQKRSAGTSQRKRARKRTSTKKTRGKKSDGRGAGAGSRRSGRSGALGTLRDLASTAFFKAPKTIGDVQHHLDAKKGLRYEQTSLSGPLLRLVREGVLDRDKNDAGTYEYKLP